MMSWGYVSGYFDGEGHVAFHLDKQRSRYTYRLCWYNTHAGSLEAIQKFIGAGRLRGTLRPGRTLPIFTLNVARRADLLRVGAEMLPHLIVKQAAVTELLAYVKIHVREQPDDFARLMAIGIDEITRLYHEEGLRPELIAARLNVRPGAIRHMLRRHGVALRAQSEAGIREPKSQVTRERMRAAQARLRLLRKGQIA